MVVLADISAVVEGADSTAVTEALVEILVISEAVVAARVLSEASVETKVSSKLVV